MNFRRIKIKKQNRENVKTKKQDYIKRFELLKKDFDLINQSLNSMRKINEDTFKNLDTTSSNIREIKKNASLIYNTRNNIESSVSRLPNIKSSVSRFPNIKSSVSRFPNIESSVSRLPN